MRTVSVVAKGDQEHPLAVLEAEILGQACGGGRVIARYDRGAPLGKIFLDVLSVYSPKRTKNPPLEPFDVLRGGVKAGGGMEF